MITNKEITAVKLSPTKKDFYQIWNELLDVAGNISERWDPASTNESDPGIVLLKVLTAVADKLNYNIDANTLEAFMPSAAQEDSMRKLTEMMGYNMKYYQSATTEVKISYNKNATDPLSAPIVIDAFTNIKDTDDTINYVTLQDIILNADNSTKNVECMEGELVECETDDNNIVSMFHLDDNYRYFFPELQIAENGIFVNNITGQILGEEWKQVSNLNAQSLGSKVFKFGVDSQEGLPYIQFPDDISTIIEDGLKIKYIRTSGIGGNISVGTLSKMESPISWTTISAENKQPWHDVNNYNISNIRAATNGANKEGLNKAYNNFKRTVGTFETLVTCRDYMNKIYQLVSETDHTTPLVSNVIVSDIRDDINRAVTLGTFTSRGLEYKTIARTSGDLSHFDLMIYPFNSVYGLNTKAEFVDSFKYTDTNLPEIINALEDTKTLAHNFVSPSSKEIACIKNYYKLRAKINTVRKVGTIEQASILANVYTKLYEHFNMRQIDFGEEIPYDTLLNVMETADSRIKNISLDDPELKTTFCTVDNTEYSTGEGSDYSSGNSIYNKLVLNNVLAGRVPLFNYNESFKPDFTETNYSGYAAQYPNNTSSTDNTGGSAGGNTGDNTGGGTDGNSYEIYSIETKFELPTSAINGTNKLTLLDNEVIQFRAPSLKTLKTYPAYVHYYLKRKKSGEFINAVPATMQSLRNFLKGGIGGDVEQQKTALEYYANSLGSPLVGDLEVSTEKREDANKFSTAFDEIIKNNVAIFTKSDSAYVWVENKEAGLAIVAADKANNENKAESEKTYTQFYTFKFDKNPNSGSDIPAFSEWFSALTNSSLQVLVDPENSDTTTTTQKANPIKHFYYNSGINLKTALGKYVGRDRSIFKEVVSPVNVVNSPFDYYYVPRIWTRAITNPTSPDTAGEKDWHTLDGLGQNIVPFILPKNTEYRLDKDEYLYINYSSSSETNSEEKIPHNEIYGEGDIIKANFEIADSADWANNHTYTKTSGYSFSTTDVPGMFTLGSNEQIEIRDIIQVKLGKKESSSRDIDSNYIYNIYWELNNEETQGTRIDFPFDTTCVYKTSGEAVPASTPFNANTMMYLEYTLKDGEYFYYTDMNKTDLAFCGSGTTIKRTIKTPAIYKYTSDPKISAEDISSAGLNAAIPWRTYNFKEETNDDKTLTILENQYINLTKGDKLINIVLENSQGTINADYKAVSSASYNINGEGEQPLPPLNIDNYKWEVRSKLDLAVSPTVPQTLTVRKLNSDTINIEDIVLLKDNTGDVKATLKATDVNTPLSIKTNKIVQSTSPKTDVTTKKSTNEGNIEEIIADLKVKVFKKQTLTTETNETGNPTKPLNLNNYGDGTFTAVNFKERLDKNYTDDQATPQVSVKLNVLIPPDSFGLIMIYYENLNNDKKAKDINPKITADSNCLKFFNTSNNASNYLTLKHGINIIQISEGTTLTITTQSYTRSINNSNQTTYNNEASIIFSSLDIIYKESKTTTALNPKLCYKLIEESVDTAYEQILKDIKTIDTKNEFYYNMPIAGNLDIDMNPNDSKDTMENPLNWFNYNNINNKFVIAELDSASFLDNITIAKASRSNY